MQNKLSRHLSRGLELYRTVVRAYDVREIEGGPAITHPDTHGVELGRVVT